MDGTSLSYSLRHGRVRLITSAGVSYEWDMPMGGGGVGDDSTTPPPEVSLLCGEEVINHYLALAQRAMSRCLQLEGGTDEVRREEEA